MSEVTKLFYNFLNNKYLLHVVLIVEQGVLDRHHRERQGAAPRRRLFFWLAGRGRRPAALFYRRRRRMDASELGDHVQFHHGLPAIRNHEAMLTARYCNVGTSLIGSVFPMGPAL